MTWDGCDVRDDSTTTEANGVTVRYAIIGMHTMFVVVCAF